MNKALSPAELTAHKASFEDGVQIAWDATSLELAQTCLRKYYYTMILGVTPKSRSVHLLFGGIYASALELFYKLRAEGIEYEAAVRQTVRHALEESWDREANSPKDFNDTKKTRPNLIRTIVWYIDQFAAETEDGIKTYHLQNGKPAVELSFSLEAGDDIIFCGHLDRVVEYGDALYVMDQKTTGGTIGPYFFEQFKPNMQMSMYTWAGQVVLHSPVKGVIIDGAQIAVGFTRFERGITTRTKDELQEWFESVHYIVGNAQAASRRNEWPMNTSACGNYGGCPFRLVCSRSPQIRESYLRSEYTSHVWDPIKRR